ncbi:TPA: hypothetical protein N0F65_012779 [Lagenidium giganteum]|uniref:Uncharacterized protein n=1 Tax=Lagenidium giganteum TaxID=4803 RepID=A0AAV2YIJ0_9STRA|nr:TPA: hypothetical protein N0F65_012779 [Lagenidium giganteum]
MIRRDTNFQMLDDLVEASKRSHFRSAELQPRTLVMRAKVLFADRVHDYLLPQIWNRPFASTVQSVYYPPTLLMQLPAFDVCGFAGHAPSFCRDYWPNYARFYRADDVNDPTEAATGQIAQDIRKRFKNLQRIVLLLIGAYVARRQEEHYAEAPWYTVVCGILRAVANIPCQGLVYGSPLPTFCYVLAHAIDSPIAYEVLYEKFGTMLGANTNVNVVSSQAEALTYTKAVKAATTNPTVCQAQLAWRNARTLVFDHATGFSWLRVVSSAMSLLFLCSDIARSGVGVELEPFERIQPNVYLSHGPWAYPVYRILHNETTADIRVWFYKFDSTSVVWRASAQSLRVASFPPCVVDYTPCVTDVIDRRTAFQMLDDLVDASAAFSARRAQYDPRSLTMRATVSFKDRFHDYILPELWNRAFTTTVRAVYFPADLLMQLPQFDVCGFPSHQPTFCRDLWANFGRFYGVDDPEDAATGRVAQNICKRFKVLQAQYPEHVLDMTILSQIEVPQVAAGGFQHSSGGVSDASTIIRVRDCRGTNCTTLLVDDYRYEVGTRFSNNNDVYSIAATLRCFAQAYFIVRILLLFIGAYVARRQEEQYATASRCGVIGGMFSIVAKMPCQGVVYGSPLPTFCYLLAHCIDAPTTYEILYENFGSVAGILKKLPFLQICKCCAVQMRNIWLLGGLLQLMVWARAQRHWSPVNGIRGVPEVTLTVLSASTLFASYRGGTMRSYPVLRVTAIRDHDRAGAATLSAFDSRGRDGNFLWRGVMLDVKFLLAVALVGLLLALVLSCAGVAISKRVRLCVLQSTSTTPVPFSAGVLWPTAALCINWGTSTFPGTRARVHRSRLLALIKSITKLNDQVTNFQSACPASATEQRQFVRYQFDNAHQRLDEMHGMVAMLNLFAMTDPLTLLRLRTGTGVDVCYLEHVPTGRVCCLPRVTVNKMEGSIPWHEMRVIQVTNTAAMSWSDLLHCG